MKNDYLKVDKNQQLRGNQSIGIEGLRDSKSNLRLWKSCVKIQRLEWVF